MKQVLQFVSVALLIACGALESVAQVTFEGSGYHLNNTDRVSFIPKVFTDMNGDFRDDILLVADGDVFQYAHSQANDSLFLNAAFDQAINDPWANGAVDLDNDGVSELFFSGFYDGVAIYKMVNGIYVLSQQLNANIFAQAFSIADINNDGFVDLFICNDDGLSSIFINDGSGVLVDESDMIDMRTTPASDDSGNYGSNWTDIDGDGDLDLYIVKCRLGVQSAEDPRRINALFVNNGDGTFTEEAAIRNIAVGEQSWASDFADVDRDGDLDLFIVNHEFGNQLFYNDGNGVFTEDTGFRDLVSNNGLGYQALATDLDNNGWVDLIVAGEIPIIYYNSDGVFSAVINDATGFDFFASAAYGDVNEDGFMDLYTGANALAGVSGNPDIVYINQTNDNHYLTVSLQGVESNRQAIGTKVSIVTAEGTQVRFSSAGTSYSIQNTGNQHFGLGQMTSVQSMTIEWPSGQVDTYTDIAADTHFLAVEGECLGVLPVLSTANEPIICEEGGESIEILASSSLDWSTGVTGQSISVNESGVYQGTLTNDCTLPTNTIAMHSVPNRDAPLLNIQDDIILCDGDFFTVQVLNYDEIEWQNGVMSQSLILEESTTLQASLMTECGSFSSEDYDVTFLDFDGLLPISDSQAAGDIFLQSENEGTVWYSDSEGVNQLGTGAQLPVTITEPGDTTFYFNIIPELQLPSFTVGLDIEEENLIENTTGVNGLTFINAQRDLVLKTVDVNVVEAGVRELILLDSGGNEAGSTIVDIQELGLQTIEVNWFLEDGQFYRMTTNEDVNMSSFGTVDPRFSISFNPGYPLTYDSWLTVTNSTFPSVYFYFYNWVVEEPHNGCMSEILEYNLSVVVSSTDDLAIDKSSLNVMPNPTSAAIRFNLGENQLSSINRLAIYNSMGKQVYTARDLNLNQNINVGNWPSGQYIIKLIDESTQYISTFTKN
jgi:hypothetical protein